MTIEKKNDQTKNKLLEAIDTNKKISFGIIVLVIIDIILRFIWQSLVLDEEKSPKFYGGEDRAVVTNRRVCHLGRRLCVVPL